MSNENIRVDSGIGKIENLHGNIHFYSTNKSEVRIRKDFQSIEEDIYRLYEFGRVFHKIRDDFTHYKNREDFHRIYGLPKEQREVFDILYKIGGDSSFALYNILGNLNEVQFYPSLSNFIDDLEKSLSWKEKINSIVNRSKEVLRNLDIDIYAIKGMNTLHEEQIVLLVEIERIIKQLKQSDLYYKENNIDKSKIVTDNAPEVLKISFWFFELIKKYPFVGIALLLLFVGYLNKDWIYTQNKHFIDTKILKKQIGKKQKNELDNIQSIAIELQKYWDEIKDKKLHLSTYGLLILKLGSLGLPAENLVTIDDLSKKDFDKLQDYQKLHSKVKGYIENKYPEYKYFFEAINDLAVLIYATPSKDYADFFNENWKKFEDSCDFVVPHFHIDESKDNTLIKQEAQKIYIELLNFLRKD